jgi:hypothetical protein
MENRHKDGQNELTDFIIPWNRVLLEKLLVVQMVIKYPAQYETSRFTTVLA